MSTPVRLSFSEHPQNGTELTSEIPNSQSATQTPHLLPKPQPLRIKVADYNRPVDRPDLVDDLVR
jgi:hypothetical protein